MKKLLLLLVCLIAFIGPAYSNDGYRICGEILNFDDVGSYSIKAKIGNDSIIGTFATHDFRLPVDSVGQYSVMILSRGFEPINIFVNVDNKGETTDLGSIELTSLKSIELNEVTVTAEKLKIRNIGSSSEFTNLKGTYLGNAGSILDMLSWTPGIIVRGENSVSLSNGSSAEIYIDNRKVANRSELLLLRSDDVAKIEIIRNPGARYSQATEAVINITLRKTIKDYLGLNVNNTTKIRRKVSNATDVNLSGKAGKFSANLAFRYDLDNTLSYSEQFTQITNTTTNKIYSDLTSGTSIRQINAYHLFGGLNYKINTKSNITAQYSFGIMDYSRDFDYTHNVKNSTDIYTYLETHRLPKIDDNTHSVLLGYYLTRNSTSSLNLTANYMKKNSAQEQHIVIRPDVESDPKDKIDVENEGNYDLANFEGNYNFTVNKTNLFDMGLSSNYISNNTRNLTNNDLQLSNRKDFVQGAYFSYQKSIKKVILSAEVRYEYNYTKLTNNLNEKIERNYNDILPFLRVIYNYSDKKTFVLAYQAAVIHPTISQLNSVIHYSDSLHYTTGNPGLKSQRYDRVWAAANIYNFTAIANYRHGSDAIVTATLQDNNSNIIVQKPINARYRDMWSLECSYRFRKSNYSISGSVSGNYTTIKYPEETNMRNRPLEHFEVFASLNFNWQFLPFAEVYGYLSYHSPWLDANMKIGEMWNLELGVKARFLKNKLRVTLEGTDLLGRGITPYWSSDYLNISEWRRNKYDTRGVKFSVQYIFNIDRSNFRRKNIATESIQRAN